MASGCEFVLFSFQLLLSDQMYSGIHLEKMTVSEISCATMCADRAACASFFYRRDEGFCFLSDIKTTAHKKLSPRPGMKLYKKTPRKACSVRDYVYHADGDFCYKDWKTRRSFWNSAKVTCARSGGMLMKADTADKHRFLVSAAESSRSINALWLGGSCTFFSKKTWKWIDGTPIVNDYWQKSRTDRWPSNNCLSYGLSQNEYKWDDASCIALKGFFCEAPVKCHVKPK